MKQIYSFYKFLILCSQFFDQMVIPASCQIYMTNLVHYFFSYFGTITKQHTIWNESDQINTVCNNVWHQFTKPTMQMKDSDNCSLFTGVKLWSHENEYYVPSKVWNNNFSYIQYLLFQYQYNTDWMLQE